VSDSAAVGVPGGVVPRAGPVPGGVSADEGLQLNFLPRYHLL